MDSTLARTAWHHLEAVNAVTYFAPECREAPVRLGLKGFWMGYFACRAAPLGPVGPGVVEATFYNFHPARVRRAIPDAWDYATPAAVLDTRAAAAAAALRRLLPDGEAERLAAATVAPLAAVVDGAEPAGRPLFAANRDVPRPDDPVADLWQLATTLREHRGDGHVAAWISHVDSTEITVLSELWWGIEPGSYVWTRGYDADDVAAARGRLTDRGLLDRDGALTDAGRDLREQIEVATDRAERDLIVRLGDRADELFGMLAPLSRAMLGEGGYPPESPANLPRNLGS